MAAAFPVEEILKKRGRGRKVEYLLKWKDYDSSYNSWEPQRGLIGCENILAEFEKKKKREYRQNQGQKIVRANQLDGRITYTMKWKGMTKLTEISATEALALWPKLISDFLETLLVWVQSTELVQALEFENEMCGTPLYITYVSNVCGKLVYLAEYPNKKFKIIQSAKAKSLYPEIVAQYLIGHLLFVDNSFEQEPQQMVTRFKKKLMDGGNQKPMVKICRSSLIDSKVILGSNKILTRRITTDISVFCPDPTTDDEPDLSDNGHDTLNDGHDAVNDYHDAINDEPAPIEVHEIPRSILKSVKSVPFGAKGRKRSASMGVSWNEVSIQTANSSSGVTREDDIVKRAQLGFAEFIGEIIERRRVPNLLPLERPKTYGRFANNRQIPAMARIKSPDTHSLIPINNTDSTTINLVLDNEAIGRMDFSE